MLRIPLSGKQSGCNEADGCLPGVSRSLSLIYPSFYLFFFFLMVWLGWVFSQSQPFSQQPVPPPAPPCLCVCVCGRLRAKPCPGYADRRLSPQFSGFQPVGSAAGKLGRTKKKKKCRGVGTGGQRCSWLRLAGRRLGRAGRRLGRRGAAGPRAAAPLLAPAAVRAARAVSEGFVLPSSLRKEPSAALGCECILGLL